MTTRRCAAACPGFSAPFTRRLAIYLVRVANEQAQVAAFNSFEGAHPASSRTISGQRPPVRPAVGDYQARDELYADTPARFG